MAATTAPFDHYETRPVLAALGAAVAGWFGGAAALSLVQAVLGPSGNTVNPYLIGAIFGFIMPMGWPFLFGVWAAALLAHAVLRFFGRDSRTAYALSGAVIGFLAGPLVIGFAMKEPLRAALCGVPVGIGCGLLFRRIVFVAPRAPGRAPGTAFMSVP